MQSALNWRAPLSEGPKTQP